MNIVGTLENQLTTKINRLEKLIGNTPLFDLSESFSLNSDVQILAKLEWLQFGESVKARPAFQIIKEAVERGDLHEGKRLLDATSGNTGIAYASIGRALGIQVSLCLPENASKERKQILERLGVEIIYTSKFEGTDGAQQAAKELATKRPDLYYYADQYKNDSNWRAHYVTTSQEILQQTSYQITHFVAGLGTTGTIMGNSRGLKEFNDNIEVIALEPNNPMHGLEGWKHLETAKVPGIYNANAFDSRIEIDTPDSYKMVKSIAEHTGLMVSPSSAANLLGAIQVAEKLDYGVVVTTFADSAAKYSEVIHQIFK